MTTATANPARARRVSGARVLASAAVVALALGLVITLLGALIAGSSAAWGALVGVLLCVAVFGFGAATVEMVAGVLPSAALLVAMLTYTLQVVLMALAFAALNTSGALDSTLDPRWLGGTIMAGTVAWLVAQVVTTMRRRIPVFDLPDTRPDERPEAGER